MFCRRCWAYAARIEEQNSNERNSELEYGIHPVSDTHLDVYKRQWQPRPEPLTLGRTIGTLLAGAVPLIGWVVLLIWAFESGAEPNRRTLARGCLVVKAIGCALVVLLYVLLFVFTLSMAGAML